MRESCVGCVHHRAMFSKGGYYMCHYILDMNTARETPPEECKNNGKYISKNSKKGKAILLKKSKEAWEYSVYYLKPRLYV